MVALPLTDLWDYLDDSETNLQLREIPRGGFFSRKNKPSVVYTESVTYRIHRLCSAYFKKNHSGYKNSEFRNEIEYLIWNIYYPQLQDLRSRKPAFRCYSGKQKNSANLRVNFVLDSDTGFIPNKWELQKDNQIVEIWEDTNRNFKPDVFTKYSEKISGCIREKYADTNHSGNPDMWFIYDSCKLVKVLEDYNENGSIERTCYYNGENNRLNCEGLGDKNLKIAEEAEAINDYNKAVYYLQLTNLDYTTELGARPRHACDIHLKIIKLEYELKKYDRVVKEYNELESNPHCKNHQFDAQFLTAYVNLYIVGDWKKASEQYERANKAYKESYGWDSIDINLSLAYAYNNLGNYSSCLNALQRIQSRPFKQKGLYFFHYYKGSCLLGADQLEESISAFATARTHSPTAEDLGQVYLKLGMVYKKFSDGEVESKKYFQKAIEMKPSLRPYILEILTPKTEEKK